MKSLIQEKKDADSNYFNNFFYLVLIIKKQEQSEKNKKNPTENQDFDEFDDKFSERQQTTPAYFPDKVEMKHTNKVSLPSLQLNKLYGEEKDEEIKIIPSQKKHDNISPKPKTASEIKKSYETFEFLDILRNVGLNPDELDKLAKNKQYSKIVEVIEQLNRVIVDKNLQSRILIEENEYLNEKNTQLNNDNMFLGKQFDVLKKENAMLLNKVSKTNEVNINDDTSMINNNTSNITINNVNINAINSINKVFPPKKKFR
jgi:hypothetical protein